MGRKHHWRKVWSCDTLADDKVRDLTFAQQGFLARVWDFLDSQTDVPGKFIVNGKTLSKEEIVRRIRRYSAQDQTRISYISAWYERIISTGIIAVSDDGTHYSPRIYREYLESKANEIGGAARHAESVTEPVTGDGLAGDRTGDLEAEAEEEVDVEEEAERGKEKKLKERKERFFGGWIRRATELGRR